MSIKKSWTSEAESYQVLALPMHTSDYINENIILAIKTILIH